MKRRLLWNTSLIKVTSIVLLAILTTYIIEIVALTSTDGSVVHNIVAAGYYFVVNPVQWVSVIWLSALYYLLISVLNRLYLLIATLSVLLVTLLGALYFKIQLRGEAIVASDVHELKSFTSLIHMVDGKSLSILISVLSAVVLLVVVSVVQVKNRLGKQNLWTGAFIKSKKTRLAALGVSLVVVVAPFIVPQSKMVVLYDAFGRQKYDYSSVVDSNYNGALLVFLNSLNREIIEKPAGYSDAHMQQIYKKYANEAKEINATRNDSLAGQTVVYVLSESLSNSADVPGLSVDKPVSTEIDRLKGESTIAGKMISSGFGGGTANVEYMTLTGMPLTMYSSSMTTPYVQLPNVVNSMPTILDYFDSKTTVHPYMGSFYNRNAIYNKIGMDKFVTIDKTSPKKINHQEKLGSSYYIKDSEAYNELIDNISSDDTKSQFLQLLTIQNHTPYVDDGFASQDKVTASGNFGTSDSAQINAYLSNVRETDKQTRVLLDKLNKMNRPVTVVFYGDHWPTVYSFVNQTANPVATHTTDYFIWQNEAAKKVAQVEKDDRIYAAPSDFSSLMLRATNTKVSPYFAIQTKLAEAVPAIASYTRTNDGKLKFVDQAGKEVEETTLSKTQREYLTDMRHVMYDLAEGEGYLLNTTFFDVKK